MKAAVVVANEDVQYQEIEEPQAKPGWVKIKVKASGICGSDVPRVLNHGVHFYPIVLGHEFSGDVVEVGEGVTKVKVGDRVSGAPLLPCMKCDDCQNGNFSLCKHYSFIGSRQQGSNANYVVIPEQNAIPFDPSISYEQGAMFEPSTVALHGLLQNDYQGGRCVAILGCGTIGIFTMQWAKIFGSKKVVVFDISEERLDLAMRMGADAVINTTKENYMEERYDQYIGESYQAMERTNFYDAVYSPVILILNAIVVAVVMLLSAGGNPEVLAFFGMSAGTAVAVINYISQIFGPVESLGMEIQTIQSAVAGVHRINEFFSLEELPEKTDYRKESTQKKDNVFVEFQNVTFAYEEQNVLNGLSFQVKEGEQVTLSGRTGAGKSTIFKLLLGLYEPKEGSVLIQGVPAQDIPDAEKRHLFGYVEQAFHMVPGTVKEQITLYDPSITMEDVRAAAQMTGLSDTIMSLENGYDTPCSDEIFSQGQWQLLSIARAAAAKPKLLLLDEITANLDAQTEKEVLQALKRVSENRTVISISHRVNATTGRVIQI